MFLSCTTKSLILRGIRQKVGNFFPQSTQQRSLNFTFSRRGEFSTYRVMDEEDMTTILQGFDAYNQIFNSLQEEIDDASKRYRTVIDIQDTPNRGRGLFAARSFSKGDEVMIAKALKSIPRNSHTVQTGFDEHVFIDLPARFINHSCNGNVGIQDNDVGAYDFFALRNISEGDELLWDYESSENEVKGFDTCTCGSPKCRGSVGGFAKHGEQIKKQYGKYYANYLK